MEDCLILDCIFLHRGKNSEQHHHRAMKPDDPLVVPIYYLLPFSE